MSRSHHFSFSLLAFSLAALAACGDDKAPNPDPCWVDPHSCMGGQPTAGSNGTPSAGSGGRAPSGGSGGSSAGSGGAKSGTGGTATTGGTGAGTGGSPSGGGGSNSTGGKSSGGTAGMAAGSGGNGGASAGAGGGGKGGAGGAGGAGAGGMGPITELASGKVASADSEEPVNPASSGNDGAATTRWCASDGAAGHWWRVDLGAAHALTSVELTWEYEGRIYGYVIETSTDDIDYTEAANLTANTSTAQVQTTPINATARYVRVRVTAVQRDPETWASFFEAKVFGR